MAKQAEQKALDFSALSALTMSSREIADLTKKQHKDVMRDIRNMLDALEQPSAQFCAVYKDQQLIDRPCFNLPKRETLILVSGYSIPLRSRIIDRWQELEEKAAKPAFDPMQILNDPAAMRGLLLTYTEKVIALEIKVQEQAPKVEALDRIATAEGALGLQAAAKVLQRQPNKFVQWLREQRWIYRRAGSANNYGYQEKIQSGYLTHKAHTVRQEDGTEKIREQVMVTPKGLARLSVMLNAQSQGDLF